MVKVLISFVVGLAVAALAFSLFDKETASAFLERSGRTSSSQSVETPDPGTEGGPPNVMPNEFATDSGSGELEDQGDSVDENSTNERPPPERPIYLPAEFDWIAESPVSFRSFDSFQREPYDVNWAPAMEAHLSQFLRENPEITQTYGNPILNCRTTRCELAFVAYGLDATLGLDDVEVQLLSRFTASLSDAGFFERSEFEGFKFPALGDNSIFLSHHTENGVTSIRWQLSSRDRRAERYADSDTGQGGDAR